MQYLFFVPDRIATIFPCSRPGGTLVLFFHYAAMHKYVGPTVQYRLRSMKHPLQKILIVGLFLSEKNRHLTMRTAADQLAELLQQNGVQTINVSNKLNKFRRFAETVLTILLARKQYDIGIVPLYGGTMSYIWEAVSSGLLRLLNKKVVLIVHGGSIPATMNTSPGRYLRSFKKADVVICPSAYLQTVLQGYGIESMLIENVVQLREYTYRDKHTFAPSLFWMRTLEEVYNPAMAIQVGGLLAKRYPQFKMVMAGYDRGLLPQLQALAAGLGIGDRVIFPGYISQQQKEAFAAGYDIYICTNRIDNAPVSFIEMMAMGLPIVSVKVGGIPYIIKDGENGLLVAPDDATAMAEVIISLVQQPGKARYLAENGYTFSRGFDAAPVFAKWLRLFNHLSPNAVQRSRPALKMVHRLSLIHI